MISLPALSLYLTFHVPQSQKNPGKSSHHVHKDPLGFPTCAPTPRPGGVCRKLPGLSCPFLKLQCPAHYLHLSISYLTTLITKMSFIIQYLQCAKGWAASIPIQTVTTPQLLLYLGACASRHLRDPRLSTHQDSLRLKTKFESLIYYSLSVIFFLLS